MSKLEKLKQKIREGQSLSYEEAETLLLKLGFHVRIKGSHHVFSKEGYENNLSLKRRSELLPYQIRLLQEALQNHEEKIQ